MNPNKTAKSNNNNRQVSAVQTISFIIAFAMYGGLVGGPLTLFWTLWLEKRSNGSQMNRSTSWNLLLDQLVAQPPMLLLMHLTLDMAGAAIREIPRSWNRSLARTGQSVVASWRFWPAAIYLIHLFIFPPLYYCTVVVHVKTEEKPYFYCHEYGGGLQYWMSRIARHRAQTRPISHA